MHKGCPPGYYEDTSIAWPKYTKGGAANPDYCIKCPAGQYQDYRNQVKGSPNVCKICPVGKFGDESTYPNRDTAAYCQNCPAGRYGTSVGSTDALCTGPCSAGYYCPSGVANTDPENPSYKIQAGYFGVEGSSKKTGSSKCPAGYYCKEGTANTVCGEAGAVATTCRPRCGWTFKVGEQEKVYCPAGSSTFTYVDAGYYSAGIGDPHHPKSSRDQQKPCKPPNFCVGGITGTGTEEPCPAGKYGASSMLKSNECDGDCAPGFFCTAGSDQNDENRCGRDDTDNPQNWFCPKGSSSPNKVGPNKMSFCCAKVDPACPDALKIPCSPDQRHYEGPCPTGFSCEYGKPVTIQWRDKGNIGQCYADDISKPNIGQAELNVAEGRIGAIAHLSKQDEKSGSISTMDYGIRALDGSGEIITSASGTYTVESEACTDGSSGYTSTGSARFEIKFDSSSHDYYVVTKEKLTYAGPGSCAEYSVVVGASSGNAAGRCTIKLSVKNENDPPVWNPDTTFELAIPERSVAGAAVNLACKAGALDRDNKKCHEISEITPNADLEKATDADAGQDVLFTITQPISNGAKYPLYPVTPNPLSTDKIFGISKCTGDLYVQDEAKLILNFKEKSLFSLCVSACDDPTFFGCDNSIIDGTNETDCSRKRKCAANTIKSTCLEDGVTCDDNSICYDIFVTDVNDPPKWMTDESVKCSKNWRGQDCVSDCCGFIKEKRTQSAKVLMSVAPVFGRGNSIYPTNAGGDLSTTYPNWDTDWQLDRGLRDLIYDPDDPESKFLTYSVRCLNCPKGNEKFFMVNNITNDNNEIKKGLMVAPQLELNYGDSPSYSLVIEASDGEFVDQMTMTVFVEDVNEPPIISGGIVFSEHEECGLTASAPPQLFESTVITAIDPEGSKYGSETTLTYEFISATDGIKTDYQFEIERVSGTNDARLKIPTGGTCLDYESIPEINGKRIITVKIKAIDDKYTRTCVCTNNDDCPLWQSNSRQFCSDPVRSSEAEVTVEVLNINEPVSTVGTISKSVPENVNFGHVVVVSTSKKSKGGPYSISDNDDDQTYTWSWSSSTSTVAKEYFTLDETTGKITVRRPQCVKSGLVPKPCLDYYNDSTADFYDSNGNPSSTATNLQTYVLSVEVTDDMSTPQVYKDTTSVVVTITDVNEDPEIVATDGHLDHVHTLYINEDETGWDDGLAIRDQFHQLHAIDPDERGLDITTYPGTWSLIGGQNYTDEVTDNTYAMFGLTPSGMLKIVTSQSHSLDFEKARTYNLEIIYTDDGSRGIFAKRKSPVKVLTVNLLDVNEPPLLEASVKQDSADHATWYSFAQHVQTKSTTCGGDGSVAATLETKDKNRHFCNTGVCLDSDGITLGTVEFENEEYIDFCNSNVDCESGTYCVPKEVKSKPFIARDPDKDTIFNFEIDSSRRCTISNTGFDPGSCVSVSDLRVDNFTGAVTTSLSPDGPSEIISPPDPTTHMFVLVARVLDGVKNGNSPAGTSCSKTPQDGKPVEACRSLLGPNKWATMVSDVVSVYFKMTETNIFPRIVPPTSESMRIREDATDIDNTSFIGELRAIDDKDQSLTWSLRTLANGKQMDPTMSDNTDIGSVASLRGDKIIFVDESSNSGKVYKSDGTLLESKKLTLSDAQAESLPVTESLNASETISKNYLVLAGEGINFEREGDWDTKPQVSIVAEVDDGNGGSARRKFLVEILDVNEEPRFKSSGYAIEVRENSTRGTVFHAGEEGLKDFVATDPDTDDILTYSVTGISAGQEERGGAFSVEASTRNIILSSNLNYEEFTSYSIKVTATDRGEIRNSNGVVTRLAPKSTVSQGPGGTLSVTAVVSVTVLDCNEPPTLKGSNITLAEDEPGFRARFELGATGNYTSVTSDPDTGRYIFTWTKINESPGLDMFMIDNGGSKLLLRPQYESTGLDFENSVEHVVTVQVSDGWNAVRSASNSQQQDEMVDGPDLTDIAEFTIAVTDVNDIGIPVLNNSFLLSTFGGEKVQLVASNLGPTNFKCKTLHSQTQQECDGSEFKYKVSYGGPQATKYTARNCARISGYDNRALECETVPGVGTDHKWKIEVEYDGEVTTSEISIMTSSYKAPTLDLISADSVEMLTIGGTNISLFGTNMGPIDGHTVEAFYVSYAGAGRYIKYVADSCKVVDASTEVQCKSVPGVGIDIQWCLRIGRQWTEEWCETYSEGTSPGRSSHNISGNAASSSYALPLVRSIEGEEYQTDMSRLRARGGEYFDISGENFGPAGTTVEVSYGPSIDYISAHRYKAVGCVVKVEHTKIRCVSAPGVGTNHVQYVVAGGQESANYFHENLTSYRPPQITSVSGAGALGSTTAGGTTIIISGNDFGPSFTTVSNPCSFERAIATFDMTDYLAANISSMYAFGTPMKVGVEGETYQAECCRVESDERVVCKNAQGTGLGKNWHIRIGNQWSNVNKAGTSYGRPVIIDYEIATQSGISTAKDVRSFNTSGGESIVIVGKNFGFLERKIDNITYGMVRMDEFQIDTSSCKIIDPHTKIRCPMVEGAGYAMSWRVVVDGQASAYPTSAYGPPVIDYFTLHNSSFLPDTTVDSLNSHGGQTIIIHGHNFGPRTEFITKITYGPLGQIYTARNCTILVKSTQIMCLTAPGVGLDHKWIVSVRGQVNEFRLNEPTTSYARPRIISISPGDGPTNGGIEIELKGYHFGAVDKENLPGVSVFFGSYSKEALACKEFEVRRGRKNPEIPNPRSMENEETITFKLPEFHSARHPIRVGIGANTCPVAGCAKCPSALYVESDPVHDDSYFDYEKPKIEIVQIRNFVGAQPQENDEDQVEKVLIIEGSNFCSGENCGKVWVGPYQNAGNRSLSRIGNEIEATIPCTQYNNLDRTGKAPLCEYTHNRISFILPVKSDSGEFLHDKEGTVWIEAGLKNVMDGAGSAAQITDSLTNPPRTYQDVAPVISDKNRTDLDSLVFDTTGGCTIWIHGKYFYNTESQICVTVGECIPRPANFECGNDCVNEEGEVTGKSAKVVAGSLKSTEAGDGSFAFQVPAWQGQYNDFFVWRGEQASVNDYVPGSKTVREFTLSYKRVGDFVREGSDKSCGNTMDFPRIGADAQRNENGGRCAENTCTRVGPDGEVCVTPKCYSDQVPELFDAQTDTELDHVDVQVEQIFGSPKAERIYTIPTSGARINIRSSQLGRNSDNTSLAPLNSYIVFGAFYQEPVDGWRPEFGERCLRPYKCTWLESSNRDKPKCGCQYPDLTPGRIDLWKNPGDTARVRKNWTDKLIQNVLIPAGTGAGYKLQIVVNGVPSQPVQINYEIPTITTITDTQGRTLPALGGTKGGEILTVSGTNFGCLATIGTIGRMSDNNGTADGKLSYQELYKFYGGGDDGSRTANDKIAEYDLNEDTYIDRMEYEVWEREEGPAEMGKFSLNLCQGPPDVQLFSSLTGERFECHVVGLTHNQLTCKISPGEGRDLTAELVPAGNLWTIETCGVVSMNIKTCGASRGLRMDEVDPILVNANSYPIPVSVESAFSYKIPRVTRITTNIRGLDCITKYGHACGPSSAVFRNMSSMLDSYGNTSITQNLRGVIPVILKIEGENFGRAGDVGAPVSVELLCTDGAKYCGSGSSILLDSATMKRDQHELEIRLTPGFGENLVVRVTTSGQSNVVSTRFSYLEPRITAILPYSSDSVLAPGIISDQDRRDGKFFQRKFVEADVGENGLDGMLDVTEFRSLLTNSESFRIVVDLTARDAERIFDELDFDRSGLLSKDEFISIGFPTTDACEKGAFESITQWQDRVNKASKSEVQANPLKFARDCLKPRMVIFFGENLGPVFEAVDGNRIYDPLKSDGSQPEKLPRMTQIWIGSCTTFSEGMCREFSERCIWESDTCNPIDSMKPGAFEAYDPTRKDFSSSKCSEISKFDTSEQSWLVTCSPVGLGSNHNIYINVSKRVVQSDSSTMWSYAKPVISSSLPKPYDASGEVITIRGENLGGVQSPVNLNTSSGHENSQTLPCDDAKWLPSHDSDGRPYLTCRTRRDVVGSKQVELQVALQSAAPADALKDTENVQSQLSRFHSVCKNEGPDPETGVERAYYGKPGQLCAQCPAGALCLRDSYQEPTAIEGFWRDELDLTEGISDNDEPLANDAMGSRALDDVKRAAGESNTQGTSVRFPGCAPERLLRLWGTSNQTDDLNSEDRVLARDDVEKIYEQYGYSLAGESRLDMSRMNSKDARDLSRKLKQGYPHAIPDDRCPNFQGCQPKEACKAGNTCSENYQHTKLLCEKWEDEDMNSVASSCALSLQCYARSAGATCVTAIPFICNCPHEWEVGSFSCQKECLRDPEKKKLLEEAQCDLVRLDRALARQPPSFKYKMNGAQCRYSGPNSTSSVVLDQHLANIFKGFRDPNSPTIKQWYAGALKELEGDVPDFLLTVNPTGQELNFRDYLASMEGTCQCMAAGRCALCSAGTHYRVSGECIPCPQHPEMLIAAAICGLLFICIGMRELDKRNFNLAL